MTDFVHLHCHTEYSLLDGAIRIKDLCAKAKEYGMSACAITDHGNLYGAAYFYDACKNAGIKPIIGCEVYVCKNYKDKTPETGKKRNHLILLAQNDLGYHNLVKLVTEANLNGYYYKPRIDKNILRKYQEGLICLSACLAGEIPQAILEKDLNLARNLVKEYADIFPNRFYLELQSNGLKEQEIANASLLELAKTENIPLVATNDCHYLNKQDAYAHEVLLCIQTQTTIDDPRRMRFETEEFYYKPPETMEREFAHIPEAIRNTVKIAEACNVELDFGNHYFPVYPLPEGASMASEFRRLAQEGLEKRLAKHPDRAAINAKEYWDRLEYELKVIEDMGFPGYFLIVQEFINWAKDHGIPVGPGRGSAAGSLTAWALRITNLDPLPYNLLFERFLNIERVSLPDIDVDFCERKRVEVIRHMVDTYGESSVAQITTFGTMKAKAAVRDVGRALGISLSETDRIAKLIPFSLKMTIDKALELEPELKKIYQNDARIKNLLDVAKSLEGLVRHASTHAAGLVVSDKPMQEYLPLYTGKRGELVTQFDGPMTEKTGLVKFDFLGLKTMTLIQDTLENIAAQGKEVPDLETLPLTDKKVYELYAKGETDGIFQVESNGMRQYLRQLKPSCFEDIIAMLALYRPGPLGSGMVDEFIKRKHGQTEVKYPHEKLKKCLKDTYGVIVYQEQVMQIAQIIAGYTLGGADLLRRAMGKKKIEAMKKEREKFVSGAAATLNVSEKQANEIFDLMEKFAEYGFNKSHSAAYALISYYTAYLKVYYPVEFMAALLSSEMGNQDKLLKYISVCRDMNIPVMPPSVNSSQWMFSAYGENVLFGLGGIKSVGDEAIKELTQAREQNGEYTSLFDFCQRINKRRLTKRVLEALIKSGACDCFGVKRAKLLAYMPIVANKAQKSIGKQENGQISLLGDAALNTPPAHTTGLGIDTSQEPPLPELDETEMSKQEKEALGFFLTNHPLQPFTREIPRVGLITLEGCNDKPEGAVVKCAVLVTSLKEFITKKGDKMAFVNVEDLTGHAEITFFARDYGRVRSFLQSERPLCVTARIDRRQGQEISQESGEEDEDSVIKLIGTDARFLDEVCQECPNPLTIDIPQKKINTDDLTSLRKILSQFAGSVCVEARVHLSDRQVFLALDPTLNVNPDPKLHGALRQWAI